MKINNWVKGAAALGVLGLAAACGTQAAATTPATSVPAAATQAPAATTSPAPAPVKTVYVPGPTQPPTIIYVPIAGAPAPPSNNLTVCGGGVFAGSVTSCPFALNVAASYPGPGQVANVYSPVTGLNYTMTYSEFNGTVVATGGNNAYVQFPG